MIYSKTIKSITLSSFVILIAGFVAYRAGIFKSNPHEDDNAKQELTTPGQATDTNVVNVVDSPVAPEMMSSSKSIILPEKADMPVIQKPKQKKEVRVDSLRLQEFMGSSKSGIIFRPERFDTSKTNNEKE